VRAHHLLLVQAFFFMPGIFLYGLATGTLALGIPFAWGMSAGVLVFVALYNFARSLASGAVSIVAPVFRLSFAITAALAVWLLDEPLTAWKLAGLAASLVAVWLLLGARPASAPRATASSVLRVLVATVAMGNVSLVYKLGAIAGGSPATILAGQASVFLPLSMLFALARDRGAAAVRARHVGRGPRARTGERARADRTTEFRGHGRTRFFLSARDADAAQGIGTCLRHRGARLPHARLSGPANLQRENIIIN
jgi:multidrug transporter EmrE-like cation transporter